MYKQGQLFSHYKDIIVSIYNKYGCHNRFTYKNLKEHIDDYNMSIHRKLLADEVLVKRELTPIYHGTWTLTLNKDVELMIQR